MPTYLSPGVYVEEVEAGSRPIEGVGTAVAGQTIIMRSWRHPARANDTSAWWSSVQWRAGEPEGEELERS